MPLAAESTAPGRSSNLILVAEDCNFPIRHHSNVNLIMFYSRSRVSAENCVNLGRIPYLFRICVRT